MANSSDMAANAADRIVEEAVDLLQQLHFDQHEGNSREGDLVTVRATPERVGDSIRLLVTCYAHGHRTADWHRLRIAIAPQTQPDQLMFLPLLDERGQASLSGLTVNEYRLVPYFRIPHWFRLGAENQQAGAVARQVAVVGRIISGETVVTYETAAPAAPQTAASTHAVVINEPMRFVDSKGIQIDLIPDGTGLRVGLTQGQSRQASDSVELCLTAPASVDSCDQSVTLRQRVFGRPSITTQCCGDQKPPLLLFEIIYRLADSNDVVAPA